MKSSFATPKSATQETELKFLMNRKTQLSAMQIGNMINLSVPDFLPESTPVIKELFEKGIVRREFEQGYFEFTKKGEGIWDSLKSNEVLLNIYMGSVLKSLKPEEVGLLVAIDMAAQNGHAMNYPFIMSIMGLKFDFNKDNRAAFAILNKVNKSLFDLGLAEKDDPFSSWGPAPFGKKVVGLLNSEERKQAIDSLREVFEKAGIQAQIRS